MNYTEKYHLPQWDETDRIMRTDFNRMCRDMEAGLEKTISSAAELDAKAAADAAAADAKNAAAAQKAQSTADRAVADAAKAQAKADAAYAPDQPPYVVGAYTGSGSSLTVTLGFRPKFVIATSGDFDTSTICVGMQTGSDHLRITDSGFTVSRITYGGGTLTGEYKPHMCPAGTTYNYIAFR